MDMPTLQQAKLARRMLRVGEPIPRVLAHFGNVYGEAEITAGIARLRAHCRDQAKKNTSFAWKGLETVPTHIPDAVKADRDHRASLVPLDTTALRMGDPLPGYSALERTPSIAPGIAIVRDPLDGLVFGKRRARTGARFG